MFLWTSTRVEIHWLSLPVRKCACTTVVCTGLKKWRHDIHVGGRSLPQPPLPFHPSQIELAEFHPCLAPKSYLEHLKSLLFLMQSICINNSGINHEGVASFSVSRKMMDYLCYIDSFTPILFSFNYFDSHNLPPNTDNFLVSGLFGEDSGQEQLPCSLKAKGKDGTIIKYISWGNNQIVFVFFW